eukprot:TRINITY_DN12020_c0_g1_i3.p1 TRINITY_DN12020_c0_g1~~TRINITY_DN12020_c0_g1_i3.p1  ORF type:complete len:470 (+),score=138.43 TRINITY_DN12020_c0_g1_i3:829-2238(+)
MLKLREQALEASVREARAAAEGMRERLVVAEAENGELRGLLAQQGAEAEQREREQRQLCELLDVDAEAGFEGLMDYGKGAEGRVQALQEANWRLTRDLGDLRRELDRQRTAPQAAADAEALREVLQLRSRELQQVERQRADSRAITQLQRQLHQTRQGHEETKLKLFDLQERFDALQARHREGAAASRQTVRALERKLMRNDDADGGSARSETPEHTPPPRDSVWVPGHVCTGQRVAVLRDSGAATLGTVRYYGHTRFAAGEWVGIEVDDSEDGRHDGEVDGVRYFRCAYGRGLFVRPSAVAAERSECRTCVTRGARAKQGLAQARSRSTEPPVSPPRRAYRRTTEPPVSPPRRAYRRSAERGRSGDSRAASPDPFLSLAVSLRERLEETQLRLDAAEGRLAKRAPPAYPERRAESPLRSPPRPENRRRAEQRKAPRLTPDEAEVRGAVSSCIARLGSPDSPATRAPLS